MKTSRRSAFVVTGSLIATGSVLAAAYFPLMFNRWLPRDDEGVFTYGLREFLSNHGHLYSTIWSDLYGPFYYLFMSSVFRVIHQQPSLENARWIVLSLTTASAVFFAGAVWKITKSLPASLVAEVMAFVILIGIAGGEPLHPGSLEVLLVSVAAFELASYAASRRTQHLVVIGLTIGALLMTKVNAGGLVAVAVVFGLLVGNRRIPRWLQIVVAVATALVPVALMSQHIWEAWADTFALVVIGSIIGMFVLATIDPLTVRGWSLVPVVSGAAVAVFCSFAFPVLTGTPLSDVVVGVFVRPLKFSSGFTVPAAVTFDWLWLTLTAVGVGAAIAFRSFSPEKVQAQASWTHATLAALALWILGLGIVTVAGWLPILVVLPALAICCDASESVRLALRLTVLLAALQILVAYPVAGSQIAWGSVAMVVPCGIALAVGIDYARFWREAGLWIRGGATAFVCVAIIVMSHGLPMSSWKTYADSPALGLPGTGLMRIDPAVATPLREVTRQLRKHCDTFYGVPDLNSFYIFSGLPAITGMVANGTPDALTPEQQRLVIDEFHQQESAGKRVCILRDGTVTTLVPGPLTDLLNLYSKPVATVGNYTISRRL